MDADKLKKLAELLRKEASRLEEGKQQKLASITLAAAGLELLRRKIAHV
jgi:hypothetical protein